MIPPSQAPLRAAQGLYLWVAVASAGGALVSAIFAVISFIYSRRALVISERQEARKLPELLIYLADGYIRTRARSRIIGFSISVSNRSDADNSIAMIELQVDYTSSEGARMTVRLPCRVELAREFSREALSALAAPLRIDAHQTVSGWVFFELTAGLFGKVNVDTYTILLTDAHQSITRKDQPIVSEFIDEAEEAHV